MKQAFLYVRFSPRPNAEECLSCEKQAERCRAYCDHQGYEVAGTFSDEAVSGGTLDRPGLSAAIGALAPCSVLVVDAYDRLARDMLICLTIRHRVSERGATIECADGSPSTITPEGELFANILAAFAQYERSRVRLRTSRGIKKRQAAGEWFGRPPIGWMLDPRDSKKLLEHPIEQDAIRKARYMSKRGWASEAIANLLTQTFGPCRGRPWSARTVRSVLKRDS